MNLPRHIEERLQRDMGNLLEHCEKMELHASSIQLLGTDVSLKFSGATELHSLIHGAFFERHGSMPQEGSSWNLCVIGRQSLAHSPDLSWYSPQLSVEQSEYGVQPSWMIHSDCGSGVTTVIFPTHRTIALLLRRLPELDPRAFITPFRIAISWITRSHGGTVLHASAMRQGRHVLAFAGPSGSGKSTLAQALHSRGWLPIADDAIVYRGGYVLPIYRRLKWELTEDPSLQRLACGKPFVSMDASNPTSIQPQLLTGLIFPVLSSRFGISVLPQDEALIELSRSSLSELAGGFGGEERIYADVTSQTPTFRLSLGPNIEENAQLVEEFFR